MKTALLFTFCLSLMQCVLSQDNSIEKNTVSEKYALTLTPAFFPYDKMGLQPGFQFKVGNHIALMNEIAFPIVMASKYRGGNYDKTEFLRVSSELKFFREKSPEGRFSSLQLGYIKRSFIDDDSGWYHSNGDTIVTGYTDLRIKSPVFFCTIKMGGEMIQWKKVFMDFFIGLGIRFIPTKYNAAGSYVKGPWSPPVDSFAWLVPGSSWQYNQTLVRPHLSLGFRIGRKF